MIEEKVGQTPSREVDPDLIVAMGAAIQGAIVKGENVGSILVDIATHTFSTAARTDKMAGLACVPINPRGTPLPVTRSEAFRTVSHHQEVVRVEVYQGESVIPEENLEIGEFEIEGLSEVPAGNVVLSEFSLDLN